MNESLSQMFECIDKLPLNQMFENIINIKLEIKIKNYQHMCNIVGLMVTWSRWDKYAKESKQIYSM